MFPWLVWHHGDPGPPIWDIIQELGVERQRQVTQVLIGELRSALTAQINLQEEVQEGERKREVTLGLARPRTAGSTSACERERDSRPVVLIGFKRPGNRGVGYLAATLELAGYRVEVVDFEEPPGAILETVRRLDPVLVGFSLIFQFTAHPRFESLARRLRAVSIPLHDRGHFRVEEAVETLRLMPQLDTVAVFEGELTLLELVDALSLGRSWRAIGGIVHRGGIEVDTTVRAPCSPIWTSFRFRTARSTRGRFSGADPPS